nr:MAG TPA: hypothetical protein [Caudoviricetes sp.]
MIRLLFYISKGVGVLYSRIIQIYYCKKLLN